MNKEDKRKKKDCAVNVGIFKSVWKESCGCNVLRRIVSLLVFFLSLFLYSVSAPNVCEWIFFSIPIRNSIVRSIDTFFIAASISLEYVSVCCCLFFIVFLYFDLASFFCFCFFFRRWFSLECYAANVSLCSAKAQKEIRGVHCIPLRVWCYIQSYKLIDALVTIPDLGWGVYIHYYMNVAHFTTANSFALCVDVQVPLHFSLLLMFCDLMRFFRFCCFRTFLLGYIYLSVFCVRFLSSSVSFLCVAPFWKVKSKLHQF